MAHRNQDGNGFHRAVSLVMGIIATYFGPQAARLAVTSGKRFADHLIAQAFDRLSRCRSEPGMASRWRSGQAATQSIHRWRR